MTGLIRLSSLKESIKLSPALPSKSIFLVLYCLMKSVFKVVKSAFCPALLFLEKVIPEKIRRIGMFEDICNYRRTYPGIVLLNRKSIHFSKQQRTIQSPES